MMMKTRVAAVIFAGAGFLAVGGGTAALASSGMPAASYTVAKATAGPAKYVVLNCAFKAVVRPGTYTIACADAGTGLQDLHWTSWTPHLASAYGIFWENDCRPNCAEGHIRYYQSREVLWGSASVKGHPGWRRYTRLTVIFTGKRRPPVYVLRHGRVVATYPLTQTFPAS